MKRAWFSLLLLLFLYFLSLGAELVCNSKPLIGWGEGRLFFPVFCFYSENEFLHNGNTAAADYRKIAQSSETYSFHFIWPLVKNDPYSIVPLEEIERQLRIYYRIVPLPQVAGLTLKEDGSIIEELNLSVFLDKKTKNEEKTNQETEKYTHAGDDKRENTASSLEDFWVIPDELKTAMERRWKGSAAPAVAVVCMGKNGIRQATLSFPESSQRKRPRNTLKIKISETDAALPKPLRGIVPENMQTIPSEFERLPDELKDIILKQAEHCIQTGETERQQAIFEGHPSEIFCVKEKAVYPFRPIPGHWLGIDDAGRDVFARIFYGLRIALNFGLILVVCSMTLGALAGMGQGYFGGWCDIAGQRFIEIWSALPFLYVMILLGSIYGTSFALLLVCYAAFNWIGISYYMRAEMLKLKKTPFVEAAKCMGVPPWKIALKHILPNSLVPVITFFPFSLIGAIGSLAALDYLGFGLPAPTSSIGQLLQQAQMQKDAWWLILFPSLTLFFIMMMGVFVGEGVRNAWDPRRQNRLQ